MPFPIIKRSHTSSLLSDIEFIRRKEKKSIKEYTEVFLTEKETATTSLEGPAKIPVEAPNTTFLEILLHKDTESSISILDGITFTPIEDIQRSLPSSVVDTQPPQSSNVQHLVETTSDEDTESSISILDGITFTPIEDIQRSLPSSVVDTQPPQSSNVQHLVETTSDEDTESSISILDGITFTPIEDIQRSLPSSVVDTQPPQSSHIACIEQVKHLVETTSDSSFFDGIITMPIDDIKTSLPSSVDPSQHPLSCCIPCNDQEKYLPTVVQPSIGSSDPESPASLSSLSDEFSYSGLNLPHQCISEPAVEEQVGKVISIGPDLSTIKKVRNQKRVIIA